ncbi:diketogulonate reductase-like aldo/keto reductase [Virgibacillus natechei]|uniref:Diketogulonate reductase-like aldo/keto reductase n=1 Tax=Virgibacillus natechei TaxID=1216297 RepID=A0ABS4IIA5_9BACI|nr:aldo/keto reductase [Virgibacillus natechei]MBP1970683.1 diketogulonate reductase-like aldo/keto reductase [Virgibacillus natechei]UZD12071.1 aldo/keto reductase [Virgibacillus natechei]
MINHLQDTITLNNGVKMPGFGLGVYKVEDGDVVIHSVKTAIEHGYRSIDTASFYDNETGVGQAIKESGVPREELFITSKVWNDDQGYEQTLQSFETSLKKLGVDYLDLYLIHWPVKDMYKDTWRAMEKLYEDGKIRAIGVSNFHIQHLENLLADCTVKPVINQVEYHPHLTQVELHTFCKRENIQLEAWSPLKRGKLFDDPTIIDIADKHGKTPAQVILRWDLQNDVVTIPKSITEERIIENANIYDFSLTDEEMNKISELNKNDRAGTNPDRYDD